MKCNFNIHSKEFQLLMDYLKDNSMDMKAIVSIEKHSDVSRQLASFDSQKGPWDYSTFNKKILYNCWYKGKTYDVDMIEHEVRMKWWDSLPKWRKMIVSEPKRPKLKYVCITAEELFIYNLNRS